MPSNARLVGVSGPVAGLSFQFGITPLLIGRSLDADISLPYDLEVNLTHAQAYVQGAAVYLTDLGSANGTFINGQRIAIPTQLMPGDSLTFGSQSFKFEHESALGEKLCPSCGRAWPTVAIRCTCGHQFKTVPMPPQPSQGPSQQTQSPPQSSASVQPPAYSSPGKPTQPNVALGCVFLVLLAAGLGWALESAFSGGPTTSGKTTQELRKTLRVGMTMDEVRSIAGKPDSNMVDDGPVGHTEMWTYNGLNVFVNFGPSGLVESVTTMN